MRMKCKDVVLIFLAWVVVFVSAGSAEGARLRLLRDGFVLNGVDGKLTVDDANNIWQFKFDTKVSDGETEVKGGTVVELLPCSTLERLLQNYGERKEAGYRLWGRVTKYKDKNYVFSIYFLPVTEIKQPEKGESVTEVSKLGVNDPNDDLTIPDEVLKKLKKRRIVQPVRLKKGFELKEDFILAERTGFIVAKKGDFVFHLDGLGRNVDDVSLSVLKCALLERAEGRQATSVDTVRFKVAGIVTKFKDKVYILPQHVTRAYSHGNFGR